MKIKVNKDAFITALQQVQSVINTRNPLPVLSNVLFRAADGRLELTGTDTSLTVKTAIEAEVAEPGTTTLPPKRIFGVVRELPVDTAELDISPENVASIHSGSSDFKINGLGAEDYPAQVALDGAKTFTLDQGVFKNMLRLTFKGGRLSAVATDSRRLALVEQELAIPESDEADLIVPLKTVDELLRTLGSEGEIRISATPKLAAFEYGSILVTSKLVEGVYPNFRQVVPQASGERVTLDRDSFLTAIRRTSQLVSDAVSGVKLTFGADQLEILATAPDIGEARERMAVKYSGKDVTISFNPAFLMDPLKNLTTDEVYLDLIDDTSPGVIRSTVSFVYVLMPIRLS